MIPKAKLMSDPSSVFDKPSSLVDNMEFSREQKIEILRQWKDDVLQRIVAEEEAMPGSSDNSDRLKEVSNALLSLEQD